MARHFVSCNLPLSRFLIHEPSKFRAPGVRVQRSHSSSSRTPVSFVSNTHRFSSFPNRRRHLFEKSHFAFSSDSAIRTFFGTEQRSTRWHFASGESSNGRDSVAVPRDSEPEIAMVMLGWLGAKPKQLRRYVELYNMKGIHVITFVTSVMDALNVPLGKKLEERPRRLAEDLASWLLNGDGRDRFLMFHTFSNTGWLTYGAILDDLKRRDGLLSKIKGCIVDSGGDPNIDPKVWAAGFTAAMLKKNSSAIYPSPKTIAQELKLKPSIMETIMLASFEKLFVLILNLPDINQKLSKIIDVLSKDQPPCPQLYLYSSGDRVIPFESVESFLNEQKKGGKNVRFFNFGSSAHVDHYRTFPEEYAVQVDDFLRECLVKP